MPWRDSRRRARKSTNCGVSWMSMSGAKMAPASVPHLLQALGWTLAHFLWQGTLIAMLAAIAMDQCRKPAARYAIGVAGMALMLAAPVATFLAVNGMSGPLGLTVMFRQAPSP